MSFLDKALEQAKQLQQIAAEAMQKGYEQAQPLVAQGVKQAQDLQKTLVEQAPNVTAAAQEQYNAALQHAGTFIATGKTVLEAGTNAAQQHLSTLGEQAQKAADATRAAVHEATAPKPPPNPPPGGPSA
jgi:ABC-type transporter Mla subunit MlaD